MRVKAIKRGFYGGVLREPGGKFERFTLRDKSEFSKEWMVKLEGDEPIPEAPAFPPQSPQPTSFLQLMNATPKPAPAPDAPKSGRAKPNPKPESGSAPTGNKEVI